MSKTNYIRMNNRSSEFVHSLKSHYDDEMSCFINRNSVDPEDMTLGRWINACTDPNNYNATLFREQIIKLRKSGDKSLKNTLPVITPGAKMRTRMKRVETNQKVDHLTGWMQFDIDLKDNPNIKNAIHLREQIKNIVFVAYCSLSASGEGVWGLVKVKYIEKYKEHFNQLKTDFASRGVKLDPSKGGNPTDLRYYSYDPDAYIASHFTIYDRLIRNVGYSRKSIQPPKEGISNSWIKTEKLILEINKKNIDIAPDYGTYLKIGFALANEFGEAGRNFYHSICSISPKYKECDADKQYSSCLKSEGSGITIGTFYHLCREAGIILKSNQKVIIPEIIKNKPEKDSKIVTIIKAPMAVKQTGSIAFIDKSERLLIPTPGCDTFTVYPSIKHYNERLGPPDFINKNALDIKELKEVELCLQSLTIKTGLKQ